MVLVSGATFLICLYQVFHMPVNMAPGWNGIANTTVFLDRPCERALREICPPNDIWNCSGTYKLPPQKYLSTSDDVGAWEVKLQLLKHPIIPRPSWPEMNVYGAKESVCEELGFTEISLGRNRWSRVPEDLSRDIGTDIGTDEEKV